jgi:N-hydroxyarylamine O-acetyltransferase
MVTRHLNGRHLTVTAEAVTVRRPGEPTEHRALRYGELGDLLAELAVPLTDDEQARLLEVVARIRGSRS